VNTAPVFPKCEPKVSLTDLQLYAQYWMADCESRQHSERTIGDRKSFLEKFFWFLNHRGYTDCGTTEIRQFFLYLANGHLEPEGRWGKPHLRKPLRPVSIKDCHTILRTWFRWLEFQEIIDFNPMAKIISPVARYQQKQPLEMSDVEKLLAAAKRSRFKKRNEAIILVMVDTGIRASELCGLLYGDLDLLGRNFRIRGKGNKYRTCYFGRTTARALARYLKKQHRDSDETVFVSEGGNRSGEALTRSGLLQIIKGLAKDAGIKSDCHDLRRTFAVQILNNGANLISVQRMMGHTTLGQTQQYLNLANSDVQIQHRHFSPADRM
jgi:integrase/recombinase XerC